MLALRFADCHMDTADAHRVCVAGFHVAFAISAGNVELECPGHRHSDLPCNGIKAALGCFLFSKRVRISAVPGNCA